VEKQLLNVGSIVILDVHSSDCRVSIRRLCTFLNANDFFSSLDL